MHSIEIYGFADRDLCAGCAHEHGESNCGSGSCAPGSKRPTRELVAEFEALVKKENLDAWVGFYEATDENIERHPDVKKILGMADLSPAIVLDGKLLFLGGFSPEGLLAEAKKRL
ncbi:MAG: hypothetical protein WCT14_01545 [Treponemataceae bacterium]